MKKLQEQEQKIKILEETVSMLKSIITKPENKLNKINDGHIYILDNMEPFKVVTIKDILFPEHIVCERTRRKYIHNLVLHGFIKTIYDSRWKRYQKIKEFEAR